MGGSSFLLLITLYADHTVILSRAPSPHLRPGSQRYSWTPLSSLYIVWLRHYVM